VDPALPAGGGGGQLEGGQRAEAGVGRGGVRRRGAGARSRMPPRARAAALPAPLFHSPACHPCHPDTRQEFHNLSYFLPGLYAANNSG
jgi:hypothetical protein